MAEAFADEQSESELSGDSRRTISVLLLATKWQFDTYGLSTINKSLVNNLRTVDREGKTIKIACAVLEEEEKLKEVDLIDSKKYGVKLKGAKRPRCKKRMKKPELEWLDENTTANYLHLAQDQQYDFIIGHAPYLANGCFNLKGLFKSKRKSPKTILMFHALPKDENGEVDDETLTDWLTESDIVFSLGKLVDDELLPYIDAFNPEEKPFNKLYLPSYPLELFNIKQDRIEGKVRGTQNVSMMSGKIRDLDISDLDFPLALTATAAASEHMRKFKEVRINLTLLAAEETEKTKWKETSEQVLRSENLNETGLSFQAEAPLAIDKVITHMRKSKLFLLPLKQDSPVFGTEALAAIAAGVPVLVSRYCGLAALLCEKQQDESVVQKSESELNTEAWKARIIQKLIKPEKSRQRANILREQLLLDMSIAQTHLDFINAIADSACIQLEMEMQTDSIVSEKNIEGAIEFGVTSTDTVDAQKYTIAFLKRLLLLREKMT